MHELLHAAGFYHQQSASNRDEFVEIIWDNISNGHESNFDRYNASYVTDYDTLYDYRCETDLSFMQK
jgi:Astacin (Peptidase family M12A)